MTTHGQSGWVLEGPRLHCEVPGGEVTLHVQGGGVHPNTCTLPGVDWQLREWTSYNLVASVPIRAVRGLEVASPIEGTDRTAWSFLIRNRVGRLAFTVETEGGAAAPFRAEVLSAKFPTPGLHVSFLQGLISDLARHARHTDFVPSAPTAFGVETDPRGPSMLSDLNTLLRMGDRFQEAIDEVVAEPHRVLGEVHEPTRLAEVQHVVPQLLPELVSSPAKLQRVPEDWPLASATGGAGPEWVVIPTPEETLDTPENRFVTMVLQVTSDTLERLRATRWVWGALPESSRDTLASIAARIDHSRAATFLGALTPAPLPHASQVLARRSAYRAVWDFWHHLTSGRRSVLAAADLAIANRDIATLYELWAFFALCELLGEALGPVKGWRDISHERFGVRRGAVASFGEDWSLVYNRQHSRPRAYGVPVRPDYLLQQGSQPRLAFDAKFRFDIPRLDEERYVDDGDDDDRALTAAASDIMKMHAYRDALGILSAVVVFPGNQDRMYTLLPQRGSHCDTIAIDDLITGAVQGVGAIHLRPQA